MKQKIGRAHYDWPCVSLKAIPYRNVTWASMSIAAVLSVVGGLIVNICSFLLPGYFSFRSLESHSHVEPWFTYWVVFALFSVVEHWFWFLLSRVPGYLLAKIALISWLQFSNAQVSFECRPCIV